MAAVRRPAARPEQIRRHNLALVLRHVHQRGALTRTELAQATGLNRSTIGALVGELTEHGVVTECTAPSSSTAGRPPYVVTAVPRGAYVVAIDIDVLSVTIAAVGLGGDVLAQRSWRHPPSPVVTRLVQRLADETASLTAGLDPSKQVGIGVSVPGTTRLSDGYVDSAPNLNWHSVALGELLHSALGRPVAVGNDGDLAALAEQHRGAAVGFADVICLLGRIGIGAGIIARDLPMRGAQGYAGEVGHMTLDPHGLPCHCGNRGCLEVYVGEAAIVRAAQDAGLRATTAPAVFQAANDGSPAARRALSDVATWLGYGVANLVNVLNPQAIIFDGHLRDIVGVEVDTIQTIVQRFTLTTSKAPVALLTGAVPDASLVGAAELAFDGLLSGELL